MPRKLDLTRSKFQAVGTDRDAHFVGRDANDNLVFEIIIPSGRGGFKRVDQYGHSLLSGKPLVSNKPRQTKRVISVYPTGDVYEQTRPVRTSIYGVENLIQIEVVEEDGKIVSKRFV